MAPPESRRAEAVAPGVERIEIRRGDFALGIGPDRWVINVLVLDPSRTRLALGRAHDKGVGTETTSSIARRRGALAAVNGGYFRTEGPYRGEPAGIVLSAGKILSEPYRRRPGLAVSSRGRRTRLAVVDAVVRVEAVASKNARRGIDGVNRPRLLDELILFTPELDRTTMTGPEGTEVIIDRGRVAAVTSGKGDAPIPGSGWVLSGSGTAAAWLRAEFRRGARCELRSDVRLSPRPAFAVDFVVGGGPRLVRNGRPATNDPGLYNPGFSDARHPRTAVGVRADGRILLVTVDGRQPERSVGMTIPELAALLIEIGAVEAINMDGGGSTTMVAGGRVVNSPSDLAGERPVGDALLVLVR
ncbi:MAG TPA: phosphodiester glycosidase family protein [Acidobacteriota bacterium]|nr:phosphodiester glycosidase family protein [Acidobacteriota bacterium]